MESFVNPKEYFKDVGYLKLNSLITYFPIFSPDKFSDYLVSNHNNVILINYYFQKSYDILGASDNFLFEDSKNNFRNLLNKMSMEACIKLWNTAMPNMFENYAKINKISSYFQLLDQDRIYKMLQIYSQSFMKSSKREIIYMFRLCHLLPYCNEQTIDRFQNDENMFYYVKNFTKAFSKKELKLVVRSNYFIYEMISSEIKDEELEYEANIYHADESEIEQMVVWLQDEYNSELEKVKQDEYYNYDKDLLIEKDGKLYLKMEYIIDMIKSIPKYRRTQIFNALKSNEETKDIINPVDFETLINLHESDFQILDDLHHR